MLGWEVRLLQPAERVPDLLACGAASDELLVLIVQRGDEDDTSGGVSFLHVRRSLARSSAGRTRVPSTTSRTSFASSRDVMMTFQRP